MCSLQVQAQGIYNAVRRDPVVLVPAREGDEETGEREREKKQEGEKKVQETGGRERDRLEHRWAWTCVCVCACMHG